MLLLSTSWRHVGDVGVYFHSFMASEPDGGEWLTSCTTCLEVLEKKQNLFALPATENLTVQLIWCFSDRASYYRIFQINNLMHNSLIFQQYVCYTTLLNMFRAARCSSSGGPIVSPQPLVSSPSVNSRTARRWIADCSNLVIWKKSIVLVISKRHV